MRTAQCRQCILVLYEDPQPVKHGLVITAGMFKSTLPPVVPGLRIHSRGESPETDQQKLNHQQLFIWPESRVFSALWGVRKMTLSMLGLHHPGVSPLQVSLIPKEPRRQHWGRSDTLEDLLWCCRWEDACCIQSHRVTSRQGSSVGARRRSTTERKYSEPSLSWRLHWSAGVTVVHGHSLPSHLAYHNISFNSYPGHFFPREPF